MKENLKNKRKVNNEKGITLVALVVTVVVLLILAGVTIVTLFSENGIITKAQNAKDVTEKGVIKDILGLGNLENDMNKALVGTDKDNAVTVKVKLADRTEIELTKENYGQYLGNIVTNYVGAAETVQRETVSQTYRLYYIDFDNKYGDGAGTIYLKADCTNNVYPLEIESLAGKEDSYQSGFLPEANSIFLDDSNMKLINLNPGLYKNASGNAITSSPSVENDNMKAVAWLTNTTNWESLKDTQMIDKINYVVGAPSLEMMMDSYNAHYGLTGDTPDTSTLTENSNRVKLFYQYTSGNTGYEVGPMNSSNGYSTITSNYSVQATKTGEKDVGSMYYSSTGYWLASPSALNFLFVMSVRSDNGGLVGGKDYITTTAFCPLVSLKPSAELELGE